MLRTFKTMIFLMLAGLLIQPTIAEVSWEEVGPAEEAPFEPHFRACHGMEGLPPRNPPLEKGFKVEIRERVLNLVDGKRAAVAFLMGCFEGAPGEDCEEMREATRSTIAGFWKEMRINLALTYPNPGALSLLRHRIDHFSAIPPLDREEREEIGFQMEGVAGELQLPAGGLYGKSKLAHSRPWRDLRDRSGQRYFDILTSFPLLGLVPSPHPSDEEVLEGLRGMDGQLEHFRQKVMKRGSWPLQMSFPPLVEELLEERPGYCPAAEALERDRKRIGDAADGLWLGGVLMAAAPCIMGGPVGLGACLGAGLFMGYCAYQGASEEAALSRQKVFAGMENFADLDERERAVSWEALLLPMAAWGTTAVPLQAAVNFGKNAGKSIRTLSAERHLGRRLGPRQARVLEEAHLVGKGEVGKDGSPSDIYNYTWGQLRRKADRLKSAGFVAKERRALVERGVVGGHSTFPIHEVLDHSEDVTGVIKRYIADGGDLNIADKDGRVLLNKMVEKKSNVVVRNLLEARADPNIQDSATGKTALQLAFENHNNEAVRILLRHGADHGLPDHQGVMPLVSALKANNNDGLEIFLKKRKIDLDALDEQRGEALLHQAAWSDNVVGTRVLLDYGADPNVRNAATESSALYIAVQRKNFDMASLLVARGADVRATGRHGNSPLKRAVLNKDSRMVRFILDKRADPNVQDQWGNTPLHESVQVDHRESLRMLLSKGADPGIPNNLGETAFDRAIATKRVESVQMIFDRMLRTRMRDVRSLEPGKGAFQIFSE